MLLWEAFTKMQSFCYDLLLKDWFKCKLSYGKNICIFQVTDQHSNSGYAYYYVHLLSHIPLPKTDTSILLIFTKPPSLL